MSMNKAIVIGRLGMDPELRTGASGTAVATLSVATTERVKSGDDWTDQTEWHRVVCFGRTAESVAKYKQKGDWVAVEGRIQTRKWQGNDGQDRYTTEIVANAVRFIGGRQDGGESRGRAQDQGASDDIPF